MASAKIGFFRLGTSTPMVRVRAVLSWRPMLLGRNPDSRIARSIAARASLLTAPLRLTARDTVAMDTPAMRATSRMVIDRCIFELWKRLQRSLFLSSPIVTGQWPSRQEELARSTTIGRDKDVTDGPISDSLHRRAERIPVSRGDRGDDPVRWPVEPYAVSPRGPPLVGIPSIASRSPRAGTRTSRPRAGSAAALLPGGMRPAPIRLPRVARRAWRATGAAAG